MPLPTKGFGKPGGSPGTMLGGGSKRPAPMKPVASDGLSALQARLAGAKKNKGMKMPTKKGRQKPDFAKLQISQAAQQ